MPTDSPDFIKLPPVSVCIAARNETHALARCLEHIIRSDYPKLEILVLDDSSTDDTSLIIKSFANAGVRFIPGKQLVDGWLGKNHAYQSLIDESSGDYIMFLDVDTLINETTISQLLAYMLGNQTAMISVLPRRDDGLRSSALFGTMRYYWELLLSTRYNPPAASAAWIVFKDKLTLDIKGINNYGSSVRLESNLAKRINNLARYQFLIGTKKLGVRYEKRLSSQYETAIRLYFPMNGRTLLQWGAGSLYLASLITPLILIAFSNVDTWQLAWSIILITILMISYAIFARRTYSSLAWKLRSLIVPLLIVQEIVLLYTSYFKYRTNGVNWKGRRVTDQPMRRDAYNVNE